MTVRLLRSFALFLPLISAANLAGIQKPEQWQGDPIPPAPGHTLASACAKPKSSRDRLSRLHDGQRGVRIAAWKIVVTRVGTLELYGLKPAQVEQHDLAAKSPAKVMDPEQLWPRQTTGIGGSDADMEIRWFMNKDFRLALLRNWRDGSPDKLIDFTRYDLPAREPVDPTPGQHSRNWSLFNRLNQKGVRPQDEPMSIDQLNDGEQAHIQRRYPELIKGNPKK